MNSKTNFFELSARDILGNDVSFSGFKGKVVLVVNVASRCGFTPQYTGLEEIFEKFAPLGFLVMGFPCNQFGAQEPAGESEIKNFCELNYRVTFPMFAKVQVNGPQTHPVYEFLKQSRSGVLGTKSIKWNFTKFLIDRQGNVVGRYGPYVQPAAIEQDIEKALAD
jgi:glutathione peroxidase